MIRLFIALKIPDAIKKKIITLRDEISIFPDKYKWEPEEKLHLTLKFIGEVPENLVEKISSSISFIQDYKKFNCSVAGFGFFFKRNVPKILWCGLNAEQMLAELAGRLNEHLEKFGIPAEERKFKAHLTLLRIKNYIDNDFIKQFENFRTDEIPFVADEISLIKSELLPSGSRYSEIRNFKLK